MVVNLFPVKFKVFELSEAVKGLVIEKQQPGLGDLEICESGESQVQVRRQEQRSLFADDQSRWLSFDTASVLY
jgi:hypothetical protein